MCKPEVLISLLLVSTGCLVHRTQGFGVHDIADVLHVAKDIVVMVHKSWSIVDNHIDFGEVPIPLLDRTEQKLFGKIGLINAKVDKIAQDIDTTGSTVIATIIRSLPDRVRLELRLNDLLDYITRMNVMHRSFQNYVNKSNDFERLTLEDFARTAISHDSNSVNNLIERIHTFVVPESRSISLDTGVMGLLKKSLETCFKVESVADQNINIFILFLTLLLLLPLVRHNFSL